MNYVDTVFPIEVLLDSEYWSVHSNLNKFIVEEESRGKMVEFKSVTTGEQVENLFWVNSVDNANPYSSGFQDKKWVYITENFTLN